MWHTDPPFWAFGLVEHVEIEPERIAALSLLGAGALPFLRFAKGFIELLFALVTQTALTDGFFCHTR